MKQNKLKAVIERAIENGWDMFGFRERDEVVWSFSHPTLIIQTADEDGNSKTIENYRWQEVLFNHDFAKAYWGELGTSDLPQSYLAWKHHLQQAVLADDVIDYYYKHL